MSDVPGAPDPERQALAAEYVLGTLDAREAASAARAIAADPVLATAVDGWDRMLAPLTRLMPPEAPPDGLWARIEARTAPGATRPIQPVRESWRTRLLRYWAAGATVAAVALGAILLVGSQSGRDEAPLMTVLVTDRTQPAWAASVERGGLLRLAAIAPAGGVPEPPTPEGRVLQLWALPPGAPGPTSLAILPRGQRSITLPAPAVRPVPGMLIEITLEPPGGSPLPRPSGPVLFIGRLSQPGPNT